MFISKKHLSRRTVLKGVGATVALPLLDAMVPARTALAQTAAAPTLRFGTIYIPHGVIMDVWMPKKVGLGFDMPVILKPLEGLRDHVNVFTGLYSEGANAHSACPGFFSACAHAPRGNLIELNTSIDQVIAQKIGQGTTFPSMELAIEDSSNIFGTCAADFLCTYMDTISWRTPTQPLPMELNPRVVFERMFGGDGTTPEARRAWHEQNRRSWNEATRAHNSHKADQATFVREGYSHLCPEEAALLGDLTGLSVVHLQCNSGQDTRHAAPPATEIRRNQPPLRRQCCQPPALDSPAPPMRQHGEQAAWAGLRFEITAKIAGRGSCEHRQNTKRGWKSVAFERHGASASRC